MKCDAIVLARGGSKGIPGKNVVDVLGKPLIAWTIENAQRSACVRDVVVSTDSEEIAEVARRWGARVPQLRPAEIAGDRASSESALRHALEHMCRLPLTDMFLFPQVTSPIRGDRLFDEAAAYFAEGRYDSLFSSTRVHNFLWRGGAVPVPLYDPLQRPMRQQLTAGEIYYRENGNFYICRTAGFLETGCRLFGKIGMFETGEDEALEIDEPSDLERVRTALEAGRTG